MAKGKPEPLSPQAKVLCSLANTETLSFKVTGQAKKPSPVQFSGLMRDSHIPPKHQSERQHKTTVKNFCLCFESGTQQLLAT